MGDIEEVIPEVADNNLNSSSSPRDSPEIVEHLFSWG